MNAINLSPREKALTINLDTRTYGSFAEIGAGQETAAWFFKAGAASGTIAKTISAYDKSMSDAIYGTEESGRYVVESRVVKMLNREYNILEQRLDAVRPPDNLFFAFANSVVALNYNKTNEGHGWLGIRFQLHPDTPPNDAIVHIRLLDNDTLLQQQAAGIVGVNLIYSAFYYYDTIETFLHSLVESLGTERVEIDMVRITGPDFQHLDNRLLSLKLVKLGLTQAALFGPEGNVLQPSEVFYKKNILVLRGRFRPCTFVNLDMIKTGLEHFKNDKQVDVNKIICISEININSLTSDGQMINIDEEEFIDRAEILCSLGHTVMISNYHKYYKLVSYLSRFSKQKIGLVLGIMSLSEIFNEQYYTDLKGGILESFSTLFSKNIKLYIYPARDVHSKELLTCKNFRLPENLVYLYKYLLANDKLEDIVNARLDFLDIFSDNVIRMIKAGESGWEKMVPKEVSEAIIRKQLFDYCPKN
ncbi:MAG: TonB-dependent receptor [Cytophagales bacterium]|nr:MAG: TonB-dependent receptor [Cytophagales bacterium]